MSVDIMHGVNSWMCMHYRSDMYSKQQYDYEYTIGIDRYMQNGLWYHMHCYVKV